MEEEQNNNKEMYFIISTAVQKNILLILTPQNYKSQFKQFILQHQDHLTIHEIELIKKEIQQKIRQLAQQVKYQSQVKSKSSFNKLNYHDYDQDQKQQFSSNNKGTNNNNGVKSPHFKSIEEEQMMESSIQKVQISNSSESQNQNQAQKSQDQNEQNEQNDQHDQNQRIFQESYEKSLKNINPNSILSVQQKTKQQNKINTSKNLMPFQDQQKKQYSKQLSDYEQDLTQTKPQTIKKQSKQQETEPFKIKNENFISNFNHDQNTDIGSTAHNANTPQLKKKCFLLQNYTKNHLSPKTNNYVSNSTKETTKKNQNFKSDKFSPKKINQPISTTVGKKQITNEENLFNKKDKNMQNLNKKTLFKNSIKSSPQEKQLYSQKQLTHHMFFRLNQEEWHTASFKNKSKEFDYKKNQQMKELLEIEQQKKYITKQKNLKYNSQVFNKLYLTQTQSSFNRNNKSKSKQFQEDSVQKKTKTEKKVHPIVSKALVQHKKTCRYRCQKEIFQKQAHQKEIQRKSRQKQIRKHIKSRSQQSITDKCFGKSRCGQCQCCNFERIQQRQLSKQKAERQKQRLQKQKRQKRRLFHIKKQQQKRKKKPNHTNHQYISNILSESYQELFQDYHKS